MKSRTSALNYPGCQRCRPVTTPDLKLAAMLLFFRFNAAMKRWYGFFTNNEEKLLERLDQAILDVIDNPDKTQQTTAIGTLF